MALSDITLWHNPRCSTSRRALALLEAAGVMPHLRIYLIDAPDAAELHDLVAMLGVPAASLLRLKEQSARALGLGPQTTDDAAITAMAAEPALIERPIVMRGGHAIICRPAERVLEILD